MSKVKAHISEETREAGMSNQIQSSNVKTILGFWVLGLN
jgi:hypothetical protein